MKDILIVGLGGCIGSIARYKLSGWLLELTTQSRWPLGTLGVNVLGCLVIGLLAGMAERHGAFSSQARIFLFTGLVGGFTTFSAFGLETVSLLRRGEAWVAAGYVTASVLLGMAAIGLGIQIIYALPHRS